MKQPDDLTPQAQAHEAVHHLISNDPATVWQHYVMRGPGDGDFHGVVIVLRDPTMAKQVIERVKGAYAEYLFRTSDPVETDA